MKSISNKKKHFANQLTIESLLNFLLLKARKEKDDLFADNLKKLLAQYNNAQQKVRQARNIDFEEEEDNDLGISLNALIKKFNISLRQARFILSYLVTNNALKSAEQTGYSNKSYGSTGVAAYQIINSNKVKIALEWCYGKLEQRTKVTPEWVIGKLKEIVERCMQAKPVLDKLGRATGMYTFDSSGSNRALELLAKHLGMFVERLDLTLNNNRLTLVQEKELAEMTPELATQKYLALIKSVEVNVLESNAINNQLQLKESIQDNETNKFKRK